jgi:hypothetical protein
MTTPLIRYDLLVQDAMRGVIRKVLGQVAALGELPGEHHFTISFHTDAPGVKISRRLAEQWPQEMTIILQHQYSGLMVDDLGFGVTLSFRSVPESLYIPYDSVTVFSDPSVEFGFKFNVEDDREEMDAPPVRRPGPSLVRPEQPLEAAPPPPAPAKIETAPPEPQSAPLKNAAPPKDAGDKIVSIDAFRKKT